MDELAPAKAGVAELAARLAETFAAEQRARLIAALLAVQPTPSSQLTANGASEPPLAPPPPASKPAPAKAGGAGSAMRDGAALCAGPPVTAETPNEAEYSPEECARLLSILAANPSGLSGYTLLDAYRIPPASIEFAMRDGQVARAERGLGLTTRYGGAW
jgi:hypothetical protein